MVLGRAPGATAGHGAALLLIRSCRKAGYKVLYGLSQISREIDLLRPLMPAVPAWIRNYTRCTFTDRKDARH